MFEENGKVMMEKTCPQHGYFKDTVYRDVRLYLKMENWAFGDNRGVDATRRSRMRAAARTSAACARCTRATRCSPTWT